MPIFFSLFWRDKNKLLLEAAKDGDKDKVRQLLDKGANIEATDEYERTPLNWACFNGHVEVVKMLLAKEANIEAANKDGWTPLHCACYFGRVEIVKMLLAKGANIEATSKHGWTPLHRACYRGRGRVEIVKMLLDKCANIEATNILGLTPLHLACDDYVWGRVGHVEIVKMLLAKGGLTSDPTTKFLRLLVGRGRDEEEADKRIYRMLKLLVGGMEREEIRCKMAKQHGELADGADHMDTGTVDGTTNNTIADEAVYIEPSRNILHSACHLSKGSCPPDGSLISFLASEKASQLEYGKESAMKLAEEEDGVGNHALHIFLSNESYASPTENGDGDDATRSNHSHQSVEYQIVKALIASDPSSISTPNDDYNLPLKLAMQSGLRNVIALLVVEYPEAVLMDPSLENIKIFSEVLISISLSLKNRSSTNVNEKAVVDGEVPEESKMLSAVFYLIRSRPDVVELGGAALSSVAPSVKGKSDKAPTLFRRRVK